MVWARSNIINIIVKERVFGVKDFIEILALLQLSFVTLDKISPVSVSASEQ